MTRLQLRTLWRRHVRDTAQVEWSDDTEVNDILNLAYANVQKEIVKINRNAHQFWDYLPTTSGTNWYALPATFGIRRVGLKSHTVDTSWTKLEPKGYSKLQAYLSTGNQQGKTYYAVEGQFIGIFPAPTESVSNGIELIHTPIMSMAADSDVPRIKLPLHLAIVYWAKLIALGETDETAGETRARLSEILDDLPLWYEAHSETADKFEVTGVTGQRIGLHGRITPNDVI